LSYCPYVIEFLALMIGDPSSDSYRMAIEKCELCRNIHELSATANPPNEVRRLIDLTDSINTAERSETLMICPLCGRLYSCKYDYEYLAGGSEDEWTYTRIDRKAALKDSA